MKQTLFLLLFAILGFTFTSSAQEARIKDVTISSGRGALSSGLFAGVNVDFGTTVNEYLVRSSSNLAFEACNDFVQAIYTVTFDSGSIFIGQSAGFFQNAFWVGPYFKFVPMKWLSIVSWNGVSGGQANAPAFDLRFSFSYTSVRTDVGPFWVSHTLISFQKERLNQLTGAGFNVPLGSKVNIATGCDYTWRDHAPLFSSALTYSF